MLYAIGNKLAYNTYFLSYEHIYVVSAAYRVTRCSSTCQVQEYRVTRQVLLQSGEPAPESLFGNVPDLYVYTAINLPMNRVEGKKYTASVIVSTWGLNYQSKGSDAAKGSFLEKNYF